MIVYDLACDSGHRFEGWFGSSDDFAGQQAQRLIDCPFCGSDEVTRAPMAPAVPRKGNQVSKPPAPANKPAAMSGALPPELAEAVRKMADAQARVLKGSTWVGDGFAEQSRAMHYGERDPETIHGQATPDQARELFEEGIAVAPLPFPVAPPDELN